MYEIEDHVPLPEKHSKRQGEGSKYPFADMKVGASFLAPGEDAQKIWTAAWRYRQARKDGWNYRTQKSAEGIRVWRIA